jgi:hypothetical protein
VVETVVEEVVSQVTTMAVDDKEAVVSPAASFLLRTAVEYLLQLCQTNVVIDPT